MSSTQQLLSKMLIQSSIVDEERLRKLKKEATDKKIPLTDHLIAQKVVSEETLYEGLAGFLRLTYINLQNQTIRRDILYSIPEPIAQTHNLIAFDKTDKKLKVATSEPGDIQIFEFIQKKTGLPIEKYLTTPSSLKEALKQYHKTLQAEFQDITKDQSDLPGLAKKELSKLAADVPIVRIVDTLLEYAVFEEASDIHIEPAEKEIIVRYRIDGILRQVMTLPKNALDGIIARIKILANLKVDEHRLPQDGRFKIQTDEYKVALRVSVIPTYDGEKIVLRLLNETSQLLTLEQLGLQPKPLEIIKTNIKKPHGMILANGPTGSGKTTTLYTLLNILNTPKVNISTIEDPVEYRLAKINQSQANPKIGFTFAHGLRAFLRQDPDIIMVGEIRDKETAEIAINAALTGHLVLSTLHTNDAVTTFPRLMDMGVASFLVSSTVNLIIAQRLVRKICLSCIESYNVDKTTLAEIKKFFDINHILKVLVREKVIVHEEQKFESLLFYRGRGCKQCNNSGYKGRIGIYEVMEITDPVKEMINKRADAEELKRYVKEQGMLTVLEDGFIKAKNGITTIEEVIRVSKE